MSLRDEIRPWIPGFYTRDKASIAGEKGRYEKALQTILRIFAEEGLS